MRTIRDDLSTDEIKQIMNALEADGFEQVEKTDMSINFKQGFRLFKLISTDLSAEDMGIRVDFDKDIVFKDEDKVESQKIQKVNAFKGKSIKLYSEKTRHSVSFTNKKDLLIDDDQAINAIDGWVLKDSFNLAVDNNWNAEIHSLVVYHVLIHGKDHVIIDDRVCQGTPDKYLALGQFNVIEHFANTKVGQLLAELNKVEQA